MKYKHQDQKTPKQRSLKFRITVGVVIFLVLVLLAGVVIIYNPAKASERDFEIICAFHELTGLHDPGCGMTRATYDLLTFDFYGAISNNALFVLLIIPLVGYLLLREYLAFLFNKEVLPFPRFSVWMITTFVLIVVIFTVLRNIPIYPFTFLAPID